MNELELSYEEMLQDERRESVINSVLSALVGAGVMVIIALII